MKKHDEQFILRTIWLGVSITSLDFGGMMFLVDQAPRWALGGLFTVAISSLLLSRRSVRKVVSMERELDRVRERLQKGAAERERGR